MKGVMAPFQPAQTTVVVLTSNPSTDGYYEHRFDVTRLCLDTLTRHADLPYDLLVFDNGSRRDVVEYLVDLRDRGVIQHLMLSEKNIGYGAALNMAFAAAPGEYIAYSDDDVFFYPNWLSAQLNVLSTFPHTGIVSGQLVVGDFIHDSVPEVAANYGVHVEPFDVPRNWTERWCRGLGLDPDELLSRPEIAANKDYRLEYAGVSAYAGGTGYSFMFRKSLLDEMPPFWSDRVIGGEDAEWHRVVNEKGYMRLTTPELVTDHIGNVIDDFWVSEARRFGIDTDDFQVPERVEMNNRRGILLRNPYSRRVLNWTARRVVKWL